MYYHRQLEKILVKAAEEYACITLYGARQTGKSTMVRTLFDGIECLLLPGRNDRIVMKIANLTSACFHSSTLIWTRAII